MKCLLSFYWLTVFYKLCGVSTNYLANFARLDQKIYIDMKNRYDIDINRQSMFGLKKKENSGFYCIFENMRQSRRNSSFSLFNFR